MHTSAPAAALLLATVALAACGPEPAPRNLVFVSLDTTRPDHLSAYGYPRPTTPVLADLAERSAVFDSAVAQMTITNPSHASMFTGLYPKTHGVGENTRELSNEYLTLTEILASVGFRTGGFVSGFPMRDRITGIDQGFDSYDSELKLRRDGALTADKALEWLATVPAEDRFFLFVHFYDAHGPYRLHEELQGLFVSPNPGPRLRSIPSYQRVKDAEGQPLERAFDYVDRYDMQLRYQDVQLGRILDAVDLRETAVVVVADHGETLVERGKRFNLNHGTALFDEQIRIPMLFYSPTVEARRYPDVVETVDLLPTTLDLLGLEMPPGVAVEGDSLFGLMKGGREPASPAFSFASCRLRPNYRDYRGWQLQQGAFIHTVRSRRWKLVVYPGVEEDYVELYHLEEDPEERTDVAGEHPERRDAMRATLEAWRSAEPVTDPAGELSPADLEDLKALGYVG